MMKRPAILIGIMLILLSAFPIFLIAREIVTQKQLDSRYEISHSYINSYGSPSRIYESFSTNFLFLLYSKSDACDFTS